MAIILYAMEDEIAAVLHYWDLLQLPWHKFLNAVKFYKTHKYLIAKPTLGRGVGETGMENYTQRQAQHTTGLE
jgi:hypothetical protein